MRFTDGLVKILAVSSYSMSRPGSPVLSIEKAGEPGRLIEFSDTEKIFTKPSNPTTERYISGRFG